MSKKACEAVSDEEEASRLIRTIKRSAAEISSKYPKGHAIRKLQDGYVHCFSNFFTAIDMCKYMNRVHGTPIKVSKGVFFAFTNCPGGMAYLRLTTKLKLGNNASDRTTTKGKEIVGNEEDGESQKPANSLTHLMTDLPPPLLAMKDTMNKILVSHADDLWGCVTEGKEAFRCQQLKETVNVLTNELNVMFDRATVSNGTSDRGKGKETVGSEEVGVFQNAAAIDQTQSLSPPLLLAIKDTMDKVDVRAQVSRLMNEALHRRDVSVVASVFSQVEQLPREMKPIPLSEPLLLSLIQQLACGIGQDTTKLAWIGDAVQEINPSYYRAREILKQVQGILQHSIHQISAILHVIDSKLCRSDSDHH